MYRVLTTILLLTLSIILLLSCTPKNDQPLEWSIVLHGGAGTIRPEDMSPDRATTIKTTLQDALNHSSEILMDGGSAVSAVEAAIRILEDSPEFNAGKGAVFTHERTNELDASIMDGQTLKAGAVAGVKRVSNPISLARIVMDSSVHVMLTGSGAEQYAEKMGFTLVPESYFWTERRWKQIESRLNPAKHGTVGAVILDKAGNLAAGTSTGGMTNKRFGRVGDSPIIGAGTYANNATCAVSATGHGEYFMRLLVTHDINAQMEYQGVSLETAARRTIQSKLADLGGTGGVIALDHLGRKVIQFNTTGMYRAWVDASGDTGIEFYAAVPGDVPG